MTETPQSTTPPAKFQFTIVAATFAEMEEILRAWGAVQAQLLPEQRSVHFVGDGLALRDFVKVDGFSDIDSGADLGGALAAGYEEALSIIHSSNVDSKQEETHFVSILREPDCDEIPPKADRKLRVSYGTNDIDAADAASVIKIDHADEYEEMNKRNSEIREDANVILDFPKIHLLDLIQALNSSVNASPNQDMALSFAIKLQDLLSQIEVVEVSDLPQTTVISFNVTAAVAEQFAVQEFAQRHNATITPVTP